MEKDKEILFNEDVAKKLADMLAKCLMPDTKILEQLSMPKNPNLEIEQEKDGSFKWTYKLPNNGE